MNKQYELEMEAKLKNEVVGDENEGVDCPKCLNRGYIYFVENGCVIGHVCECMNTRNANRYLRVSGLRAVAESCTFDNFKTNEGWQASVKEIALKWLKEPTSWFYIGGQVGSGKTHICTAMTVSKLHEGVRAKYVSWTDITALMRAHRFDEDSDTILDQYKVVPLLYIDDFFKGGKSPNDFDQKDAYDIINYRYKMFLPTIISSEWTLDRIEDFDESIMSRISERSGEYVVSIGKDRDKNQRFKEGE